MDKLLTWGRKIRQRFIIDNILQFKASVVLHNFDEGSIDEKFVGVHSFNEVLNKIVGGFRGIINHICEFQTIISEQSRSTNKLIELVQNQQRQISFPEGN